MIQNLVLAGEEMRSHCLRGRVLQCPSPSGPISDEATTNESGTTMSFVLYADDLCDHAVADDFDDPESFFT